MNEIDFRTFSRRPVSGAPEKLVKVDTLNKAQSLPLLITPAIEGVNLVQWAENNRELIETRLRKHGGLLFRNFDVKEVTHFEQFVKAT